MLERPPARSEDAFTIIEVLMAVTILMVALLAAAAMFEGSLRVSGDTRNRVVAANLATQALEQIRGPAADPTKFTGIMDTYLGNTSSTQVVNGVTYTISQDIQWVGQRSTTSTCDAGASGSGLVAQVTESVSWANMRLTKPVQSTTTLSPPVGAYSSSTGGLAVKVLDSSGKPASSINVQIAGPTSDTQQTTSEGCAFFAYINAGTYTASVVEGTGVGDQEQLTPAQTTSVVVGQTALLTFNYDTAGKITVTGWSNSAATPATNIPIGIANNGLQPYRMYSYPTGTTSLTPLFPYASGYTLFAGNCNDNNPLGKDTSNNPYYPGATTTPIAVTPGGTSTGSVPLYSVPLSVTSGGVPVVGATVTATEPGAPYVPVCTNGISSGTAPTLGMVTTVAGGTSTTAMPLGHWVVTVKSGTKKGTVNVWVQPGGLYNFDSSGNVGTQYTGTIPVAIS